MDIEQILLQKTTAKEDELKKAFQTLDIDQTLKVTKGEFKRVIEMFILPLTQEQFDSLLAKVRTLMCLCMLFLLLKSERIRVGTQLNDLT